MTQTPEKIMEDWEEAYRAARKKEPPDILYFNGWYTVGPEKVRSYEIIEMTGYLREAAEVRT